MTWAQMAGLVILSIIGFAAAIVAGLETMWRAQERRDQKR